MNNNDSNTAAAAPGAGSGRTLRECAVLAQEGDEYEFVKCAGGVRLTKYLGSEKEVTVPETWKGQPVVGLKGTFYNSKTVSVVRVSRTVNSVGLFTFTPRSDVYIPSTVRYIEDNAFGALCTVHCAEGSAVHVFIKNRTRSVTAVIDGGMETGETADGPAGEDGDSGITYDIPDFEYKTGPDGGITLVKYTGSGGNVVIPGSFGGHPVTALFSTFVQNAALTSVEIPYGVEEIGAQAFGSCRNLISVSIPGSVRKIGFGAFYRCRNLESVDIPDGVKEIGQDAFYDCRSLKGLRIPGSVESIGVRAFYGCSGIRSLTLPESLKSMGVRAFNYCTELESVYIPAGTADIGELTFIKCGRLQSIDVSPENETFSSAGGVLFDKEQKTLIAFPAGREGEYAVPGFVTSLGEGAFAGCALSSVILPDSVAEISGWAFFLCENLASIAIPASITGIGSQAFMCCRGLESVVIPESVASIGDEAFSGTGLLSFRIPDGVTVIDNRTFKDCTSLACVEIHDGVTSVGRQAFENCASLARVIIPDSVASIGSAAFKGCTGLISVGISRGITEINGSTFEGCCSLGSVEIPDGVTCIGRHAFNKCAGIESVRIPAGVSRIDMGAFAYCRSLLNIEVSPENEHFCSVDGVLFDKEKKKLCLFPAGRDYVYRVPDGTKVIGLCAFTGCDGLFSVVIPDSVESMENYAVCCCDGLAFVIVPASVTSFAQYGLFVKCPGLTVICPKGSPAWEFCEQQNIPHEEGE